MRHGCAVSGEEIEDDPVELIRALKVREMRGVGDRCPLRARNSRSETVGDAVDVGDVLVARQDQRRNLHFGKPFRGGRLEAQHSHVFVSLLLPEGLFLHLTDELAQGGIDVFQTPTRAGKPGAQIGVDRGVEVSAFECLLLGGEEGRHVLRPVVVG